MEVIQANMTFTLIAVLVALLIGALILIIVRRRAASNQDMPMPDIGDPVDYTSMPVEEPTNWGERFGSLPERFANLPLPARLALFAAPVLVIGLVVIAILVIQVSGRIGQGSPQEPPTPPPPQPQLIIEKARLASGDSILIEARGKNIPHGTTIQAALLADGEPFPWYDDVSATRAISGNDPLQFRLNRVPDAPIPDDTLTYTVRLQTSVNDQTAMVTTPLEIPDIPPDIREEFFQYEQQPAPTAVPKPTTPPTNTPIPAEESPEPTTPPTDTPVATVTPISAPALVARVFNGGNVRDIPGGEPIIDQVNANEEVVLLQKTDDSVWYQVRNERDNVGWVHYTLLNQDDLAQVGPQVPLQDTTAPPPMEEEEEEEEEVDQPSPLPTDAPSPEETPEGEETSPEGPQVSVFNGGNVRAEPAGEPVLDQINANEMVTLIQKNADGSWYQIRNERDVVGWAHYTLLNQDELASVSEQVPVGE
jgi:hypothetical protein